MATTYYNDLQKLYVAYFNRPGDTSGLANYEARLEAAGTDAKAIAATKAAISAEFAHSTEYTANFKGMSNADIVNTIYMNLFGRPADAGGQKFYADLLTAGKLTIDAVVTEVANGAQGSDATAYANKVTAATAFTAALTSADSYNTQDAATAAKAFLSGVTDNASLALAVDPVFLQVAIAKVDAAANPFSLQTGLSALTAAQTAYDNFLDAADGKVDGKFAGTAGATAEAAAAAKINHAVDPTYVDTSGTTPKPSAAAAVAAIVDANVAAGESGLYATSTNAAIKAALLSEAQTNLAGDVTAAQTAVTADNVAVAKIPGLATAITTLNTANDALDSATKADTAAHTTVAVAVASYNVQAATAAKIATTIDATTTYDAAVTAVSSLITKSSSGTLSLATGVTEANHPGVTALLNALVAEKTADTALSNADTAQQNAQATVDFLDGPAAYETNLKAIASAMTINKVPAGALPTLAQITAEDAGLLAAKTAADKVVTDAGSSVTTAQTNAMNAADAAYASFHSLVTQIGTLDTGNPLSDALAQDTQAVSDAQDAVSDLNDALTTLASATNAKAQLDALTGQLTAAQTAITAHGLMQPIMLDSNLTTGGTVGGADIFVAGAKSATISSFDTNGIDSLFIGSKFTALGTDLKAGNDAALEAFITKNTDGNVVISVETKTFASHETGTAPDLVQITLTGVTDVTKVHLNNGIITIS